MLELHGVGHRYSPRTGWVFRGVSLSVPAGHVICVLGPNGRGKTTLVRLAAGLIHPIEGQVTRHVPVGFVPQAHGADFAFTARDMVLMGRARHVGVFASPSRDDHRAADAAIARVGIGDLASRCFPSLSGGEQQLVLIARAVASGSPLLVLDEPASSLDLRNQGLVLAVIRSLAAEGMSVLLTTHHPDHALIVADSVVLLYAPDDVRCGPANDLLSDASLTELYGVGVRRVEAAGSGPALVTTYAVTESGQLGGISPGRARGPGPAGDR